ncbi:MAG TPA: NAD(P)-dependent oxidoreductase [Burkholderiaceae bacterium]|nr:NAD(P)-dependent oxidoreductase [Burkholderiaceae bacterium]
MPNQILLLTAIADQVPPLAEAVRRLEPDVQCLSGFESYDDAALSNVDVVLGWRFPKGLAARLTSLRWVCSMAAGVEKLLVPELAQHVPVSRVVDPEQATGMGQYAAAMILRHVRGLARYEVQQRERDWSRYPMAVARQQIVVLGWGEVGREVGRQLAALGFPVRGWRRDGTPLARALRDAQVVINTLPLTRATEGLLDAAAFAALPRGAYFVNIARGGHVVEADLIAAVRSGHLAGAALDVQLHEPLPADDPLWSVPGITITPHIAAQPSNERVAEQFVEGLRRLRRGDPLPNLIDRARGY